MQTGKWNILIVRKEHLDKKHLTCSEGMFWKQSILPNDKSTEMQRMLSHLGIGKKNREVKHDKC